MRLLVTWFLAKYFSYFLFRQAQWWSTTGQLSKAYFGVTASQICQSTSWTSKRSQSKLSWSQRARGTGCSLDIWTRGTGCSNVTPNDIHGTVADRAVRRTERARPGSNIRIYPSWPSSEVQTSLPQLQIAGPSRDQTGPVWQTNYQGTRQYLQRPKEKTQTNIGYPNVKIWSWWPGLKIPRRFMGVLLTQPRLGPLARLWEAIISILLSSRVFDNSRLCYLPNFYSHRNSYLV